MSTPRHRPYLLAVTLILLGGSLGLVRAQDDFKGARPANPKVNPRLTPPNSNGKAVRPAGGRSPSADHSEKVEEAIALGNRARDAEDYGQAEKQYKRALSFNPRE